MTEGSLWGQMILVELLYLVLALILGILAFVLRKKRTKFPDCRVGYHHKKIMASQQKWEYGNNAAGFLCAVFSAISVILSAVLFFAKVDLYFAVFLFILFSVAAIAAILIVPVQIAGQLDHKKRE